MKFDLRFIASGTRNFASLTHDFFGENVTEQLFVSHLVWVFNF